jgi:methyl-accepting chemotaxis protein
LRSQANDCRLWDNALMPAQNNDERLDRLEQIVNIIAEDQQTLQNIVTELATETRRGFDRVAAQFVEIGRHIEETDKHMRETDERMRQTGEHMRQTDERMRETDQRMRQTDERIDKLVVAIGEFIRRN